MNNQLCDWLHRPLKRDDGFHQECTRRDPPSDGHSRWWKHQVRRLWRLRCRAVKSWEITVVTWCKGMVNSILYSELFSHFLCKSFNSMSFPWLHVSVCWRSLGLVEITLFKSTPKSTAVTSGLQPSLFWNVTYPHTPIMMSLVWVPYYI